MIRLRNVYKNDVIVARQSKRGVGVGGAVFTQIIQVPSAVVIYLSFVAVGFLVSVGWCVAAGPVF